jgi:hypothetical protein
MGVDVDAALLSRWRGWIGPERQPFFIKAPDSHKSVRTPDVSPELRDTYALWNINGPYGVRWLDEGTFFAMPRPERAQLVRSQVEIGRGAVSIVRRWLDVLDVGALRSQADGHRFVWWPSLLRAVPDRLLPRIVEPHELTSRHGEVVESTWRRCAALLPGAKDLAGTFPTSSGPNCFGTVMAAACGGEADRSVVEEPFLEWLRTGCRAGGADEEPGTVLAWFDRDGRPVHAAVTLGDGWALEKPSQCWWTPRAVLPVVDVIRTNRTRGQRLQRQRIR